jgi:hypothetical protein
MAIIACPDCDNKISSQTMLCPHCGFQRGEASEEELIEFRRRKLRDQVYHMKMSSYAVLTLFLVAFGWYWIDTEGFLNRSSMGPFVLLGIAAVAYMIIRAYLYKYKSALRKLNK